MPNHVTNIIVASEEVIDSLKSDESQVDFNTVISTPDDVWQGAVTYSLGQETPVNNWYTFNTNNWGTKWNAYSIDRTEKSIQFDTAWSHPFPIIEGLSNKFPEEIIEVTYADEDLGYNLGHYRIKNGEAEVLHEFTPGSNEALEFAAQVKYGITYEELRKEWDEDDE